MNIHSIEEKSYRKFTYDLEDQFADNQNVDVDDLKYLRDFSADSHREYLRVMDYVAELYEVTPRSTVSNLGHRALSQVSNL